MLNIFQSFQSNNPIIRTKENVVCLIIGEFRIANIPPVKAYAAEKMRTQQLKDQITKRGRGYSSGMYSVARPVKMDVNVLDSEDDSHFDQHNP